MKAVLSILLVLAVAIAFVSAQVRFDIERVDTEEMWQEWQDYHMKTYASAEEAELRYFNFLSMIERAKDLNNRFNSTSYGVTMFSDMSQAEFRAKYLMDTSKIGAPPQSPTPDLEIRKRNVPVPTVNGDSAPATPNGWAPNQHYDWQYGTCVTPVYNQAQCGSCWAWSAMEQIESDHCFQHGQQASQLTQQGVYPLSTQQIVDCDKTSYGCNGGWPSSAYQYVQGAGGLKTQNQYPYRAQNGNCQDGGAKTVSISGWKQVGGGNEQGLLNSLAGSGPVSVCLDAETFNSYSKGVISAQACGTSVDHCIQLTGWTTDGNGNPNSWFLRNQWGAGWGQAGYVQIQYGANACNINTSPTQVNAN